MKLHLGCGKRDFGEDWIHIDMADFPHIESKDVTRLPYEDNSCDLVYASHLLEYFDRIEVIEVLQEWKRVLKPSGVLRLAVPDFEKLCSLYTSGHGIERVLGPLYGKWGTPPVYHKTTYDFSSLSNLLHSVGFQDVSRYDWRDTEHSHIDDHSQAYFPHMDKENGMLISLNVEAVK